MGDEVGGPRGGTAALTLATEAVDLAEADPGRARSLALAALIQGKAECDASAMCTAERALGLVAREEHDLPAAVGHLRRAVRTASRARLTTAAAEARVTLAGALALGGDFRTALREVDAAGAVLHGSQSTVLEAQRAWLLQVQGRLHEALAAYRRVLPEFQRNDDTLREAKARNNVGLILDRLGDGVGAEAELGRAEKLYTALGQHRVAADVQLNLGWVAVHRGELPGALRWFDRADRYFQSQGRIDPIALRDRCEGLLAARLVVEARQAAEQAVVELARKGMGAFLAEARLMLSEAALLDGDVETARRVAGEARLAFTRQRRPGFVALARFAELRAAWFSGDRSPRTLAAARRTADALGSAGWVTHALDARLMSGQIALESGRLPLARQELGRAGAARRRGPVEVRSRAWHAQALLRLADGDRRGAETALRAGVRMLDRYRSTLGATELRVHASAHATDLVEAGVRLALADGSPAGVFHWAERSRACALKLRPVRPPADAGVAADLAELRSVIRQQDDRTLAHADIADLMARQARLEEAVRRRMRQVPGPGMALHHADPPPSLTAVRRTLGERALVEIVRSGADLHAVVVTSRRATLRRLGPVDTVCDELEALRFSLRRLLWTVGSPAARSARLEAMRRSAERLDELLILPLLGDLGDRALVIVPTGVLHSLPWASLPSCRGRQVVVSPSAALWHRTALTTAAGRPARVVLAAGPGLPGAEAEVVELSRLYPGALSLTGRGASVEGLLAALDGADLAHVAAHAAFRADNPLFSAVQLHDGPLTVCDLERLDAAPGVIVLSACESGVSSVTAGDELIGLAAALLALGARSLVSTLLPLPDRAARPLMVGLHQLLRSGVAPAEALARIQARPGSDHEELVAASSFVIFGGG